MFSEFEVTNAWLEEEVTNAWLEGYEQAKKDAARLNFIMALPDPEDGPFTIQDKVMDAYSQAIFRMDPKAPHKITQKEPK